MTLEVAYTNKSVYSGDGATQDFAIDFDFRANAEVVVLVREADIWVRQVEGTDYDIAARNVSFLATGEPASGTNNVEIWRESSTSVADIAPSRAIAKVSAPGEKWHGADIEQSFSAADPLALQAAAEAQSLIGWNSLVLRSFSSGDSTSVPVTINGTSTITVPFAFPYPVEFGNIAVVTYHSDSTSPPSTWTVYLRVDRGSGWVILASAVIDWSPSSATRLLTNIAWTPWSTGINEITVEPDEFVSFQFSGGSIFSPLAMWNFSHRLRRPAA